MDLTKKNDTLLHYNLQIYEYPEPQWQTDTTVTKPTEIHILAIWELINYIFLHFYYHYYH